MTNQRLVLIETTYGAGLLFDQKDSSQAYQLLCRATMVNIGRFVTPRAGHDIEIKLISPARFLPEVVEPEPEPAPPPMAPNDPISVPLLDVPF